MGFGRQNVGKLTFEGAAEFYWEMLINQLQRINTAPSLSLIVGSFGFIAALQRSEPLIVPTLKVCVFGFLTHLRPKGRFAIMAGL